MIDAETKARWPLILRVVVLGIGLSMCAGFFVAFFEDNSPSQRSQLFALGFGLLAAGLLFQLVRDIRAILRDVAAMPTRERKSSRLLLAMLGAGAVAGAVIVATGDIGGDGFPVVGSLDPVAAIVIAAAIILVCPWMTARWWRETDEHERQAYIEGAHVSASIALYVGLSWWLLSRAALVPPPDGMVIVFGISLIWSAVWLYRKYS